MEWLDKLETQLAPKEDGGPKAKHQRDGPVTCWNCKGEGHISRNCPEKQGSGRKETLAAVSWATKCARKTRQTRRELFTYYRIMMFICQLVTISLLPTSILCSLKMSIRCFA